jgi:tRNA U34 2-thiouridine synthase MnmA/TrmU
MIPYTLYPSNISGKRYTIYVPKGNRLIKIDFGSSEHENYTIHKDPERKRLYRIRHKNDHINDPYSAGFWAYHVLWNKPSLQESMKDAVAMAKRII